MLAFAAGEPDFPTPPKITAAAINALKAGLTRYAPVPGDPAAREAIARKLNRENQIHGSTPAHVVITTGGKHALYLAFQSLLDPPLPGREAPEVLLPTPAWVSYAPQIRLAGGKVVELPTSPTDGFKLTPEQLRAAITPNSRVFVFNSPNNPCGVTYTLAEIEALASVIAEACQSMAPDLVVITDEMYEKLIFDGAEHHSFGAVPSVAERTITISGLSKAYSMTGWRVGYLAGTGEFGRQLADAAARMQAQTTTCLPAFIYPAIVVALEECAGDVEAMRIAFEARAALIDERLRSMPGFVYPKPTGAFYVFADISAYFGATTRGGKKLSSSLDFAEALLAEHQVAIVPGEDFLGPGRRCVRFSYACSTETIQEGMDRLEVFLSGLR